jgi:DNA-binding NtrC family response regulator
MTSQEAEMVRIGEHHGITCGCSRPSCSGSRIGPPGRSRTTGKFEAADGGTLFLDEVSDLSATAQAKLLRAIQDLAIDALRAYDWPGNVRELERVMERALALAAGEVIEREDLPEPIRRDFADVPQPSVVANDTMRGGEAATRGSS